MEPVYVTIIVFSFGYLYFRYWINGKYFSRSHRADGKTVIITGANAGIGRETAIGMAERGAKVIMACRDIRKAEKVRDEIISKTKNPNVYVLPLDLASFKSIRKFAQTFLDQEPRLDILINNAGVMCLPRTLSDDGLEMHMGVNHFGHFLLTLLLIDRLKESAPSRIVTVSSWGHRFIKFDQNDLNCEKSYNRFYAYLRSKLANVLFTTELASRLKDTGVTVNCVHPGVVHSELSRNLNTFLFILSSTVCSVFSKIFLKSTKFGAQTSIFASLDFSVQNISGIYFDNLRIGHMNPEADDPELRKWLWEKSEQITGIQFSLMKPQSNESNNKVYREKNRILMETLLRNEDSFYLIKSDKQ